MTAKKLRLDEPKTGPARRLPKAERRRQLLQTARDIVREEGADSLTLGHLAKRSGVSKPVAYDHFKDRSALLIELYRWIDTERVNTFRDGLVRRNLRAGEAVEELSVAYVDCAADTSGAFHAVGAALAGSEEKAIVFQELLDNAVHMFLTILEPHSDMPTEELVRRCIGLVGAGEALSSALVRGAVSKPDATRTFAALIAGALAN
jgi:AcrR family transcriptional regulator